MFLSPLFIAMSSALKNAYAFFIIICGYLDIFTCLKRGKRLIESPFGGTM